MSTLAKGGTRKGAAAKPWFESEKLIRFHHCDPAGIVFYPQYFVLFHELLEDWFDRGLGIDYAAFVTKERLGLPTAHIDCDFKVASKIGDLVQMRLAVTRIGNSSITLDVSVHSSGELRVSAHQVLVLISLEDGRVLPIPPDLRARVSRYLRPAVDGEGAVRPAKPSRAGRAAQA